MLPQLEQPVPQTDGAQSCIAERRAQPRTALAGWLISPAILSSKTRVRFGPVRHALLGSGPAAYCLARKNLCDPSRLALYGLPALATGVQPPVTLVEDSSVLPVQAISISAPASLMLMVGA